MNALCRICGLAVISEWYILVYHGFFVLGQKYFSGPAVAVRIWLPTIRYLKVLVLKVFVSTNYSLNNIHAYRDFRRGTGNIFNMSSKTRKYLYYATPASLMYLILNIIFEKLIGPFVIVVKTKMHVPHWHVINCEIIIVIVLVKGWTFI